MSHHPPEVLIYTMTHCPYCVSAKKFFQSKGIPFKEILLNENDDNGWDTLEKQTGYKTVPQIFINNQFVGGYSDLIQLDQAGKLQKLLQTLE